MTEVELDEWERRVLGRVREYRRAHACRDGAAMTRQLWGILSELRAPPPEPSTPSAPVVES